jgi:hypothetical protein
VFGIYGGLDIVTNFCNIVALSAVGDSGLYLSCSGVFKYLLHLLVFATLFEMFLNFVLSFFFLFRVAVFSG